MYVCIMYTGAVHQRVVAAKARAMTGLLVESGDATVKQSNIHIYVYACMYVRIIHIYIHIYTSG